jgi:serine/threonine protein phosphatase PrpC
MVTCPKCKAENRPEAAFCSRCGTILFTQPTPTKTAGAENLSETVITPATSMPNEQPSVLELIEEIQQEVTEPATNIPIGLQKQPEGSVFGDRFRYAALLSEDEHEIRYTVTEIMQPDHPMVRICSNDECRTIHCPVSSDPEKYCTQCGHALEESSLLFLLEETDIDKFGYIKHVQELNLVHPNIHPPIATFQYEMAGDARYYLATPFSKDIPAQPEICDVLDWGVQLASALDYLQSKGVVFSDELNLSSIGLADKKAVWRNFSTVRILPMLTDREKINNLRLLCLAMYSMMTGKSTYSIDPYLPSALNDMFERALVGEGFTSGTDLTQQIELAKKGGVERLNLDYQIGKHSHPGKVRNLNEDSLLSIELTSINQGAIQPSGLFAIADGMGGHAAGDLASGLVISTITQKVFSDFVSLLEASAEEHMDWLKETVQAANLVLYDHRQKAANDMGSTLVICFLVGTQAYLAHQGDSRIYLINQGGIQQLTTDHSWVQHLINIGQISQDEARSHPQRNVIYRSLGDKSFVDVDCLTQQLLPHDRLLLCSDGLTNQLDDERLQKIVMEANCPQEACDRLVEAANTAGGDDNISALLIEVIPV